MFKHNYHLFPESFYLKLHIASVSLSYVAFFVASVAAVLYLIQNHALKKKLAGIIFSRLPGLSILDKWNYQSISWGFPLLTLSILSGFIWNKSIYGVYWISYNSRQFSSLVLWLVYALILHVRLSSKLRGKKVAILSLLAFFVIILTLMGNCP